mgnify:CR=1 FL=1
MGRIKSNLASRVKKGRMSQAAADAAMAKVKGTLDYADFGGYCNFSWYDDDELQAHVTAHRVIHTCVGFPTCGTCLWLCIDACDPSRTVCPGVM